MDTMPCPYCFSATPRTPCSSCGWRRPQDNPPPALALGRVLDGRYRIGRVLGQGGFGITYLAWDDNLQLRVAIKEYLPRDCACRGPDGIGIALYSGPAGAQFAYGLDRFLEEARALAHFDQHPGIVTVKNFFRAHGTGYCVMDYMDGITLRDYLEQQPGGRISGEDALKLLMPVMDALRTVHREGLLHRDIAPDNIYLAQDGRIKLLDFGAARYAAGEHSQSLSVVLKPGYAPEEQYRTRGHQGPWTDVYGVAATFYRAITGQAPPEALDRLDQDELMAPAGLGIAMAPGQEAALLKGLAVKAGQRYREMVALQQGLQAQAPRPARPVSVPLVPALSHEVVTGKPAADASDSYPMELLKIKPPAPAAPTSDFYLVLGSGLFLLLAMVSIPVWNDATRTPAPAKETPAAPTLATLERPAPATRVTPTPPSAPSPAEVGTSPLYFAAALAPPDKIPPEAPLCYKFMVAGPEEQLKKLKDKYPDLYDYRILANAAGGKNLVAKRRDAARQEITYFYSTSPAVCNQYQQARLETQATVRLQGDQHASGPRYRFIGKDQGIVEDASTKLQWQRCTLGQTWNGVTCAGNAQDYCWDETKGLGPDGWRLPTRDELTTLVHCSSGQPNHWPASRDTIFTCKGHFRRPTIMEDAFPNTPEKGFWSSSPITYSADHAWGVGFDRGYVGSYLKRNDGHVRLVRGGQ